MRKRLVATFVVVVMMLCWSATGAVGGQLIQQTDGETGQTAAEPTVIDACTTITEPGKYVLAGDIENSSARSCLQIQSSDVVLDGGGHTIDGVESPDPDQLADQFFRGLENPLDSNTNVGVAVRSDGPLSNVTVRNVELTDWRWGVVTANLNGGAIENVQARANGFGIAVTDSSDVSLTDSIASENAALGVALLNVTGGRVTNVTASANGPLGVYQSGGRDVALSRITARDNDLAGILAEQSTGTTVFDANVSDNRMGVYFFQTTGGAVVRTTATNNEIGIYLRAATGAGVSRSTARTNFAGILLEGATESSVVNATARQNRYGVYLFDTADSRVVGTDASRNFIGVRLELARESVVSDSVASDQFAGIFVNNSVGGEITDNTVLNTTFAGVYTDNVTNVRVANNRNGLLTFESTDDEIGVEGGIRHDDEIDVNQTDGLTESEVRQYVYRAIARAEELRQLEFRDSITLDRISRETLEKRAAAEPADSAEQSAWDNQRWEALFVLGEETNATRAIANESTNVLGTYNRESNRLTMVSGEDPPVISSSTLVHELVHALQDQHFDLDSQGRPQTEDEQRGSLGLTEGDAEYVSQRFEQYCGVVWDCVQVESRSPLGGDVSENRNFALREIVLTPYSEGPQLVDDLREQGDWDAVNQAYENPPNSTEQLIHPDKRNERPVPIEFEDAATDDWEQFEATNLTGLNDEGRTTIGEAGIFTMFWYQGYEYDNEIVDVENHLVPNDVPFDLFNYTSRPSEGWGNDVFVPYRNGEQFGYVWETAWDSERDAQEFYDAYLQLLRGQGATQVAPQTWVIEDGQFADAFRVVRTGTSVTIVNGPTVDSLDGLRLGQAEEPTNSTETTSSTATTNTADTTSTSEASANETTTSTNQTTTASETTTGSEASA